MAVGAVRRVKKVFPSEKVQREPTAEALRREPTAEALRREHVPPRPRGTTRHNKKQAPRGTIKNDYCVVRENMISLFYE